MAEFFIYLYLIPEVKCYETNFYSMKKFREYHLLRIFKAWDELSRPLDVFLRHYFRENKAIGSKDRQEICDTLYGMIRWRGLLDYLCDKPLTWEKRLEKYLSLNPLDYQNNPNIPLHVRVSFPQVIFSRLQDHYGEEKAVTLCLNSNHSAPTTVRTNLMKTTREALLDKWKEVYDVEPCAESEWAITFKKRVNFFALPEFKEGLFEVQDEGSQLVANQIEPGKKDHILDYCAGSGGKTLGFAPKMNGQGQIYLYDIRPHVLDEAKKRLKRAGVQNAQILSDAKLKKKGMLERMDWILLDVPCSGSGTLRRNPDMKWKISNASLERLIEEQRKIFEKVLKFLHPKGKIVYATCSIFPEENEKQVSYFIKKYDLKLAKPPFLTFPKPGKMDGFFCAVLTR